MGNDKKPFNEMTYNELTHDALIEHVLSLGGETAKQALENR